MNLLTLYLHLFRYLDINGELLPMDDFGRPLDPINGRLLPTNEFGQYIYTAPTLTSRFLHSNELIRNFLTSQSISNARNWTLSKSNTWES